MKVLIEYTLHFGVAEWWYETASKMLARLDNDPDSVSVSLKLLIHHHLLIQQHLHFNWAMT
nr:MAG: hypothetical protein EDM05_34215 [Leptolyngbya sp. IPPAS B-1204]